MPPMAVMGQTPAAVLVRAVGLALVVRLTVAGHVADVLGFLQVQAVAVPGFRTDMRRKKSRTRRHLRCPLRFRPRKRRPSRRRPPVA